MNYAQKMWKRILSMILAIAITLTMIPVTETYAAAPSSVELDKSDVILEGKGSTATFAIQAVYDDQADPQAVGDYTAVWSSDDIDIATVSEDGTVTAVGAGNATVKVEATYTDADGNTKTSSGSAAVNVYVTPTATITATTETTVNYPTAVSFDVNCESVGKKTLTIVKDGETTPISYTIGESTTLPVGTYKVSASVDADGYYRAATAAEMTYVVEKAKAAETAISSIPKTLNCDESFELLLPEQKKADNSKLEGTYKLTITGLDTNGAATENVAPGTTLNLTAGSVPDTAKIDIVFTPNDANYEEIKYSYSINVQVISVKKSDDISLDSEVFWGDKLELKLPDKHTAENGDQVEGTYDVTVTGLKAVDANNQEITNLTGINPTTIYLNADTVTNAANVKIVFKPAKGDKYTQVVYEFSMQVKEIPVVAVWEDSGLFVKNYDTTNKLTINVAPTLTFASEYTGNAAKPTLQPGRTDYEFTLASANAGTQSATLKEALVLVESNYKLVEATPTVSVTVKAIEIAADNISLVSAAGKNYDGNCSAVVELQLDNSNGKFIASEFAQLNLSYTAEYYSDGNPEYGNPDSDVNAAVIRVSDIKITDSNGMSNYQLAEEFFDITGPFKIAKNAGFIEFTGADFGTPVTELRDLDGDGTKEEIEIYWFNEDESKDITINGFTFSENPKAQNASSTYNVANSAPTKIYAKDANGLISGGIYVAADTEDPTEGQILAQVDGEQISITELSSKYETLKDGKNIEIIFAGKDAHSKIAKIEWYGSNTAWSDETAWDGKTPTGVLDVNVTSDKADSVQETLDQITSEQELKRFYYARITDFAGNVSYISSSGVLQDITDPEAELTITTASQISYQLEGETNPRTVYVTKEKIDFQIALSDKNISSGISEVSVVLKNFSGEEVANYDINSTEIWTSGDAVKYIQNLPKNPTDTEIENANKGPLTGKLPSLTDGFYTLTVTVKDNVGHESKSSSVSFVIDNTDPEIIIEPLDNQLSYLGSRTANNLYTGGSITVTVKELTLTTDLETLLQGKGIVISEADWEGEESRDSKTGLATYKAILEFGEDKTHEEGTYDFTVNATDSRGVSVTETAKDNIVQEEGKEPLETFIIDYTIPAYIVTFSKGSEYTGENKVYYGADKTLTATFEFEEEISYDDNLITISVKRDGKEVIKWEKAENSTTANKTVSEGYTFVHDPGSKTFVITILAESAYDGEYTFEITGRDQAGNILVPKETSDEEELKKIRVIDATAPVLTNVAYDPDTAEFKTRENGKDYVNENVNMTFTLTELNPTPSSTATITSVNDGKPFEVSWVASNDKYTATFEEEIKMLGDGDLQTVTLTIVDKAGNIAQNAAALRSENTSFNSEKGKFIDNFVIDTLDPKIKLVYAGKMDNGSISEINRVADFKSVDYFNDTVYVKVIVTEHNFDETLLSQSITLEGSDVEYAETEEWEKTGTDEYVKTYTYTKDNQYNLSVKGTDCAGNPLNLEATDKVSAAISNDTVTLNTAVDTTLPTFGDKAKPIVVIKPSSPQNDTTDGQALYNSNVTFEVTVYDPYLNKYASGIDNIDLNVEAEDGTNATWQMKKDGTITSGGSGISVTRVSGGLDKLAKGAANKYVFHVTLSSDTWNSNGIVLSAVAKDIATNESDEVKSDEIAIDVTAPKVLVTYDNNDVSNEKYFHADRIATVQVTERNFSNDCLQFIINGQPVELNFTLQSQGSGNRDNAVWVATYAFTIDGDYKIDVKCVDRAQNEGTVEYEGAAPQDFTIDKTFPIITVVYDNNDFQNEYYYKEARTATITIEEHNFASADVVITLTAEDDGQIIEVPAVNGWASEGDLHTATINYNYDAEFTFDIEYADLATNEAEDYEMDRFVIDMTAPELEIFDIEHMSANNGVVRPGVRYYDTNYDQDGTVILMTGYHNGVVEMTGSRTLEENGLELKLDDFAYVQEMDDLYTMEAVVYDLAGNSSEEMVMFSVNRFGSVYTFDEPTDALIGDEGRYYTNKEQQLVIMETNVDTLEFKEITMNLNGTLTTLKEGVDYTVGLDGNEATWKQYTYTLKADNFVEEGTYILTIYSEDRATNTSDNNTKGKKIEFVVDKTNPSALISGVENGGQYRTNSKEMTIDVEDNVRLSQVTVTIDGVETVYDAAQIDEANGKLVLNIGNANHWQDVKVVVTDAAGNQDVSEEIRVLVTANIFVQFFMNKPVFYGTLGGGAVLAALLWWFLVGRKRRNEEEQAQ